MVVIVATRSRGKLHELVPMLAARGIEAIGLDAAGIPASPAEDGIECFGTFEANAMAKARYFAALTGKACIADDSGLCVDALDGRPGVRSRRFASDAGISSAADGEDDANNSALLEACWDSGWAPPWAAHFACAAAYADEIRTFVAIGRTDGAIMPDHDGSGGFGYDPYFLSVDLGVTFAAAGRDAKALISHRGRAFSNLLARVHSADAAASAR